MQFNFNPLTSNFDLATGPKGDTGATGASGPIGLPGTVEGAIFYLDSSTDPVIANYLQLTPLGVVVVGSEATLTAAVSTGGTTYLGVGGTPKSFIAAQPIGDTFVQQGEWAFDTFYALSNTNGNCTIACEVYARAIGGTETLLFTVTSGTLTAAANTPTEIEIDSTQGMYAVNTTDRLVLKFKAAKSGGSGGTTVTLYTQGTTHASHVHTTLAAPLGGKLGANLDGNGYSITNFDNGHTAADVALTSDPSASVLAVTLSGLTASKKYLCTLGARVCVYTDADHAVGGMVDIVVGLSITTDGSAVATCTLSGAVVPDVSGLPAACAGATATIAASAGGFTISATRVPGANCHARARWWVNRFEDVT